MDPAKFSRNQVEWSRKLAASANRAVAGKLDAIGNVTLDASSATTTLADGRITESSVLLFTPTTANAALEQSGMLEIDTAGLYVSARADGSATLTHANNAASDRTFSYLVIG